MTTDHQNIEICSSILTDEHPSLELGETGEAATQPPSQKSPPIFDENDGGASSNLIFQVHSI